MAILVLQRLFWFGSPVVATLITSLVPSNAPVPPTPAVWARPLVQAAPESVREIDPFTLSGECALCHSISPGASAMRTPLGDDVSPHGLWQATMMGNAFKDPYFHAQIQKESQATGEHVQELCLRCHTPMAHHKALLNGEDPPRLADVVDDPLAEDGVSCTVCHQISPDGLGEERTFSGRPVIATERKIFGPFEDPAVGPMQGHVNYTPVHAEHIQSSALCATCHTLETEHQGKAFPEQSPYLEWRNSEFSDEGGETEASRSCQQCHMPKTGGTRMARNPMGADFLIPVREEYSAHAFVGGNAFMLDMLQFNRDTLGVVADEDALARMAAATRRQLMEDTATMAIEGLQFKDGRLAWDLRIENKTGHKFPTGYPARRAFVHVQVRRGRQVVFESGKFDRKGRLVGIEDEMDVPHVSVVDEPSDVVIYEMVANDPDGQPTTFLTKMTERRKDNRLLPRGYAMDGPHVDATAPVGVDGDGDFVAGGDTVRFDVPLDGSGAGIRVVAWLHYQSVPPVWVDALRGIEVKQCEDFVRMYDAADKTPDTVAVVAAFLEDAK